MQWAAVSREATQESDRMRLYKLVLSLRLSNGVKFDFGRRSHLSF